MAVVQCLTREDLLEPPTVQRPAGDPTPLRGGAVLKALEIYTVLFTMSRIWHSSLEKPVNVRSLNLKKVGLSYYLDI